MGRRSPQRVSSFSISIRRDRIDQELVRLTKDLELTPEQQQRVRPLLEEHHDRMQTYAGRLVAENGKIKLLRESLDTLAASRAFSKD